MEDPYSDPDGLNLPDRSPEPPLKVLQVCELFKEQYIYTFLIKHDINLN